MYQVLHNLSVSTENTCYFTCDRQQRYFQFAWHYQKNEIEIDFLTKYLVENAENSIFELLDFTNFWRA